MFYRQRRFVIFSLVLFLSVLLLAKFASPLYLKAQSSATSALAALADPGGDGGSNVGTNIGVGDVTAQVDIIDNVIARNGAGAGFPVTVLLYENSMPDDVKKIADAMKRHSFFPIVRIDHICDHSVSDSQQIVSIVRQEFGADTVIAFGNEINNQEIECKDWAKYEQNYRAVQSGITAPSAIDFYNGNPAFKFDKLPGSLQGLINGSSIRAANAYGCVGTKAAGCNDGAMGTYTTGLTGTDGKKLYVTEFSLSPEGRVADAPDTDLTKVLYFIKKFAPQVRAEKITPLIRNVCNGDGEWLIYVKGQVFTMHGQNVTKSCAGTKVPFYEFNIQRETSQNVVNNFYDEYSVACLPKEEYTLGFENDPAKCGDPNSGLICPIDWKSWNIPGKLKMTADGKTYGLFRNQSAVEARSGGNTPAKRGESVEALISQPNPDAPTSTAVPTTTTSDKSNASLKQAPMYNLTTLSQQCSFVVDKLKAVHELCKPENRVETYKTAGEVSPQDSTEDCGLNTNIPSTSKPYDQESMLAAFQSKNMTCEDLADSQKPEDRSFLSDLLKVNVSMETAYRPAFIVAVTTFDAPNSTDNVTTHTSDDAGVEPVTGQKFQVIDYLEVKVPALASDFLPTKSPEHSSSLINPDRNNYRDPMQLTADVLRTSEDQSDVFQQEIDQRKVLREFEKRGSINGSIIGDNGNMPIFCNVGGKLYANCDIPAQTGDNYVDQVPPALVKFINASATVQNLGDWDSLPCNAREVDIYGEEKNKARIAEQGKTILAQLKAQPIGPYQKRTEISTNISVKVKDITKGGNITTHTELYFVTPQRYAMQYAQNSFLSFLTTGVKQGFIDPQVKADVYNPTKFSPLLKSELAKTLTGREVKTGAYRLEAGTLAPTAPGATPVPTTNKKMVDLFGLINDTSDFAYTQSIFWRVAGQVASLPSRMLALVNLRDGSPMYDYTRGCTGNYATDDWFTGNCLRAPDNAQAASPSAGTTGNVCIETKIDDPAVLADYAAKLKDYLGQASTLDLWTRYFAGYLPGATPYLFSVNDARCDASQPCYDKVIDTAVAHKINPYLAIAIALNETGGFRSNQADASGPHFGCGVNLDPNGPTIGFGTIPSKLNCMVGAFDNYENTGLDANAALTKYGYANGFKNQNLTKIIGIISHQTYAGNCTGSVEN